MLEASPDMKRESEKEWYFGNADKERRGPFGFEEVSICAAELERVIGDDLVFELVIRVLRCRSSGALGR